MNKFFVMFALLLSFVSTPALADIQIIVNPVTPVTPVPIVGPCEEQYEQIVANEQAQLNMCAITYQNNPALSNACQENVINQTNLELYNNAECRDYYLEFGVVFIPGHPHHGWQHPEHFPHHHEHHEHRYHR